MPRPNAPSCRWHIQGEIGSGDGDMGRRSVSFQRRGRMPCSKPEDRQGCKRVFWGCADKKNHVATACFGKETPSGGKTPSLYVAEFVGKSRCFVECVRDSSSTLIQTIEAKEKGKNFLIQCWVVDIKNSSIYTVSGRQTANSNGKWPVTFRKYNLPKLKDGKYVLLTEQDKLEQFEIDFPNCLQGACIKGKYMYIATGFQQSQSENIRAKRCIKIIDLQKRTLKKEIDLTYITTNEPEGLDFYHNKMILYAGQNGGLYQVK